MTFPEFRSFVHRCQVESINITAVKLTTGELKQLRNESQGLSYLPKTGQLFWGQVPLFKTDGAPWLSEITHPRGEQA